MAEELERIFIIPLKKTGFKSSKAAPTAIKRVRNYLTKHMKVEDKDIWIDDSLNKAIWSCGKFKMANKIRVKAVRFDDGIVEAYLPELEIKKSRRELLKEEREKKEPILKKEEVKHAEEGETGAEDYDITPSSNGAVKIKKKKAPKEKKPLKEETEAKKQEPVEEKSPTIKIRKEQSVKDKKPKKKTSSKTKGKSKAKKKSK